MLENRSQEELKLNARQLIRHRKVSPLVLDLPATEACALEAPQQPIVFTDSSLKTPSCQSWALGGMGIWWPIRDIIMFPLSLLELEFSYHEPGQNCISLWGAVTGTRCSSWRSEVSAGISAASEPGPVHQATDSLAYQRKVTRLLKGECLTSKKPWQIQQDGDLRQIMENVIKEKGPKSIKVTWVKGHATEQHLLEGKSTPLLALGNDTADRLAEKGVLEHCDGLLVLAHYYSAKQKALQELTTRGHKMFVRVLKEDKRLREVQATKDEAARKMNQGTKYDSVIIPAVHSAPPWTEGVTITMDPLDAHDMPLDYHLDVYNFMRTAR